MSILNKFKKKKFIYISINYVYSDLTQGQHLYNKTDINFNAGLQSLLLKNNCSGLASLAHEDTIGNMGAGSADLSFGKTGGDGDVSCIITIRKTITPTDAGVATGNDWIDIDISFFYRIFLLDSGILAHWGEVRLHEQACASNGAEIVKVEKDLDPTNAGTFNLVVTVTFVSHNPQGSSVLDDLDPTAPHCMEIDLEIVETGGGKKDFQIFIDDIKIEFSNETKAKVNHDQQQSIGL